MAVLGRAAAEVVVDVVPEEIGERHGRQQTGGEKHAQHHCPTDLLRTHTHSGQIVGERGGTAFPFRFWRGNAVPLAYTTAMGGRGKRSSVVR